ncbi:3-hydroxyacyl-CoA dehydrogenase [Aliiroseovarius halocynthiae]|uniref:3-hydroxyacyl-CoA dehydrogenase n=1 Tax=Aliiroseovarius halocynthiae TaxID=985055 RepID=A0A545SM26_9RHOB|nr:3-hydroxyacyl-CoA dehydrogenase NAD-binding domain-containing protein [Aliiroseovarius halocynthiae]TQV66011.1 3-hydroxyacyl-CoA dehydrogenase [Aliiroseovarius halocynthiae]SMR83286.1 3-hydroxyacyl-CoA dehydrogenase [Aliiroseovarius halocynthiae]
MTEPVTLRVDNSVAIITIENPPVNALSHAVRAGLSDKIEIAVADETAKAIVLRAEGRTFPAGADVREFGRPREAPILSDVCALLEDCSKPTIAAVHGSALGGGFELALACHYRVAQKAARFGLPEVKLGVLPGGGGTQRLPRIVGAVVALDLMLTGKPLGAQTALDLGVADLVVEANLDTAAMTLAGQLIANGGATRPTRDRSEGLQDPGGFVNAVAARREKVKSDPLPSVARIVDCIEAAQILPFDAGIAMERAAFDDCEASAEANAMRHAFFAERRASKIPELEGATLRPIKSIGVVGAGTMGSGIAISCLDAGFPVVLVERDQDALDRGVQRIVANYDKSVDKGRIDTATGVERLARLTSTTSMHELAPVDLIIEAVFEDEQVKRTVFTQLDTVMKPGAILATNTSYLDIDTLAATISRPQDVVGYHFFSPAHIMKLLEVVVGDQTDPNVVATGFDLARKLRKVPVRASVADGFIGNRVLASYRLAADFMLEDGASPAQIDAAMRAYGFPIGPYQVLDMAGLDISWARRKRLAASRAPEDRYVAIGDKICEQGWFGQKAGRGYYIHDQAGTPVENPDVLAIIEAERRSKGVALRAFSQQEIQQRCVFAMANEGARLVSEGVALRPSDVDVVLLYGYGFPRYRGGPMMAADQAGLLTVKNALINWQSEEPRFWVPSPLFDELIKNGRSFGDL